MKQLYLALTCLLLLIYSHTSAQLSLNPAVDTVHSMANRQSIHVLSNYLHARLAGKDGKTYWLPSEAKGKAHYDFYDAHYLYAERYDDIIVLGITQPEKGLYRVKVLFVYTGIDKVKTVWSVSDFDVIKKDSIYCLTNALYTNLRLKHYQTVKSPQIIYHFPQDYAYQQSKVDSANQYLQAIGRFLNKPIPSPIEYVTAPTCENLYAVLGSEFQAGTLSSSTTFCGYFDGYNQTIFTSGGEFYKHELLRTMNLIYPKAPDLLKSGITCLWGGSANKPMIYHIKKLYPYLQQHPEVLNKVEDFYYFDDETNPAFVFQTLIINYVLKHEGRAGLLKLIQTLKPDITMSGFLKNYEHINNVPAFFLKEFKQYSTQDRLEYDDLLHLP